MTAPAELLALALVHHRAGRFHEAEVLYRRILASEPQHPEALHLLGLIAQEAGRHDAAIELIERAIAGDSHVPAFHSNLGLSYQSAGHPARAEACFRRALALLPTYAEAHNNLGVILKAQGRLDEAIASFRSAVLAKPDMAEAHYNLGVALAEKADRQEALSHLQTCLRLNPSFSPAQKYLQILAPAPGQAAGAGVSQVGWSQPAAAEVFRQALACQQRGELERAVALFREGLRLEPGAAAAWNHLGNALQELVRLDEAVTAYRQALALRPQDADAQNNLGNTLQRVGRLDEAVACYEGALRIAPNHPAAHGNLGVLFKDQGRLEQAAHHLRAALRQQPSAVMRVLLATLLPPVYESLADLQHWRQRLVDQLRQLGTETLAFDLSREVVPNLFYLAYQGGNDRDIQRDLANLYATNADPALFRLPARPARGRKLRIGILSKYLRDHTIGTLMRGLFAELARDRFEVTALVVDNVRDAVTEFVRKHADQYVVLADNLAAARQRILELGLDVLFYADIGMDPMTYTLAFSRLAPVQCVTWGHPVTTGIPTIDYFLSSELIEPPEAGEHYTEALVRLETLPFYYYRPALPSARSSKESFGLSAQQHVYGCLQTLFKLHPEFDALVGEILRRDPQGVLVLIRGKHPQWEERLKARFARTLPDVQERVRWLPPQPRERFLDLMSVCDVLLDTIHFGGGNTSYEGLALGVPIVTLPSPFMRGRITYALYRKMGILDAVASTPEEYCTLAVALGTDPARRAEMSRRIRETCGVLFEDATAVRQLEAFFLHAAGR